MSSCEQTPLHFVYRSLMSGCLVWTREFIGSERLTYLVLTHDRWWQEGIESQAIDRCNRIGMFVRIVRHVSGQLTSLL